MTTIQIALDKEPDIAALVADLEPGDCVYGCFTIKDKSEQTLTLRIKEMAESASELSEPDEPDNEDETDEADEPDEASEPDKSPEGAEAEAKPTEKPGSLGRKLAAKMMSQGDGY